MENLTSFVNRKFGRSLMFYSFATWIVLILSLTAWGFFKTSKSLDENLNQYSSLITSLIFEKNWNLINEYLDSIAQQDLLTSVRVISRIDGLVIYETQFNNLNILPSICRRDLSSDVVELTACAQIASINTVLLLILLLLTYTYIAFRGYHFVLGNISKYVNLLSSEIYSVLSEQEVIEGSFDVQIMELSKIKETLLQKTSEIKKISQENAFINVSKKVAHDLRSPLAVILNLTKKNERNDEEHIVMLESIKSLKEIADSLLETTSQQLNLHRRTRCSINEKTRDICLSKIKEYPEQLSENSFDLNLQEDLYLWIPNYVLNRILSNLINNSIEAGSQLTLKIKFSSMISDNFVTIRIEDNGPGFSKEYISSFASKKFLSSKLKGYAIGLSSAIETLEKFDSFIKLHNTAEGGAAVDLIFPRSLLIGKEVPIVLIDNDKYMRYSWISAANEKKFKVLAFASITEFEACLDTIDKESEIYIDSDLGNGALGEDYIETLHTYGFERINLETGKSSEQFKDYKGLNDICSKTFPY